MGSSSSTSNPPSNAIFDDGRKLKIFTSWGQYVHMTDEPREPSGSTHDVKANVSPTGSSIVTLHSETDGYKITFGTKSDEYNLDKTKDGDGVEAVKSNNREDFSIWIIFQMESPNEAYYAIRLLQDKDKDPTVFLSSDGEGNMKLKPPGRFPPPHKNPNIDPGLLFRLVDPEVKTVTKSSANTEKEEEYDFQRAHWVDCVIT